MTMHISVLFHTVHGVLKARMLKGFAIPFSSALKDYGRRFTHCTGGSDQNHPQEKEMQKGKMFEEALQIAEKRREAKGKGEKIYLS